MNAPSRMHDELLQITDLMADIGRSLRIDGAASNVRRCVGCGVAAVRRIADECGACQEARIERERGESLRRAWATVPAHLRWVSLENAERAALTSWVRDAAAVAETDALAALVRQGGALPRAIVTFVGESRSGKTTLAIALLREFLRRGARRSTKPGDVAFARRVRFTAASALTEECNATPLGERVRTLDLAHAASVLVLDEVGRGLDTRKVIFELVRERHASGKPTIVTTPFATQEELARSASDGGLAGRVFEDAKVVTVAKCGTP